MWALMEKKKTQLKSRELLLWPSLFLSPPFFKKVSADDILYFSVYQIIKNQNQQWNDAIK